MSNSLILTPRTNFFAFINPNTLKNFQLPSNKINADIKSNKSFNIVNLIKNPELFPNIVEKILTSRPNNINQFLIAKGHLRMKKFKICRKPIRKEIEKIINFVTSGKLQAEKERQNFDDIFHLFLIITFENGEIYSIEKTEFVFMKNLSSTTPEIFKTTDKESECINVSVSSNLTFRQVLEDVENKLGINMYRYDPRTFNCQNFLLNFTNSAEVFNLENFIYQDFEQAISKIISKRLSITTDLGGLFARLFQDSVNIGNENNVNQQGEFKSTSLSIMSYNVKMFPSILFDFRNVFRAKEIIKRISNQRIEILVFQELFDDDVIKLFRHRLGRQGFQHTSKLKGNLLSGNLINSGVMIFSRFPIINEDSTIFKEEQGNDRLASKGAVKISIEKNRIPIDIIGTHLQAGRKGEAFNIKTSQIRQFNEKLIREKLTFIVGDWNFNTNKFKTVFDDIHKELDFTNIPTPSGSSNENFGETTNNILDHISYKNNPKYSVEGSVIVDKTLMRVEGGFKIDKKGKGSFKQIGDDLKNMFKSKKKRKKIRKRNTITVNNLSDHMPIILNVNIQEIQPKLGVDGHGLSPEFTKTQPIGEFKSI